MKRKRLSILSKFGDKNKESFDFGAHFMTDILKTEEK